MRFGRPHPAPKNLQQPTRHPSIYVRGSDIALYPYNKAQRNTINRPYTRSLLLRKAEFILFSPHGRVSYFAPHSSVSFPDTHRTHAERKSRRRLSQVYCTATHYSTHTHYRVTGAQPASFPRPPLPLAVPLFRPYRCIIIIILYKNPIT